MCQVLYVDIVKGPHVGGRLRGTGVEQWDIIGVFEDSWVFSPREMAVFGRLSVPGWTVQQWNDLIFEESAPLLEQDDENPDMELQQRASDGKWFQLMKRTKFAYSMRSLSDQERSDLRSAGRIPQETAIRKIWQGLRDSSENWVNDRTAEKQLEDVRLGKTRTGKETALSEAIANGD